MVIGEEKNRGLILSPLEIEGFGRWWERQCDGCLRRDAAISGKAKGAENKDKEGAKRAGENKLTFGAWHSRLPELATPSRHQRRRR